MSKTTKTLLATGLSASLWLTACGTGQTANGSGDGSTVLRYSTFVTENEPHGQAISWYMDQVEERTENTIQFERHFAAALVAPTDNFAAVQDGRVDAAHIANVYHSSELPLSQISLPFMTQNPKALQHTFADAYENVDAFRAEYEDNGMKVLAWFIVSNSTAAFREPVESVSDLQGLRLRTGGLTGEALSAVGADPTFMALPDAYQSLERGVLDGHVGFPLDIAYGASLQEVAPHWVDTGVGPFANVAFFTISIDTWESLDPQIQEVLTEVGQEALEEWPALVNQTDAEFCASLSTDGNTTFTAFSDTETASWREDTFESVILPAWRADAESSGYDADTVSEFETYFMEQLRINEEENADFEDGFSKCVRANS